MAVILRRVPGSPKLSMHISPEIRAADWAQNGTSGPSRKFTVRPCLVWGWKMSFHHWVHFGVFLSFYYCIQKWIFWSARLSTCPRRFNPQFIGRLGPPPPFANLSHSQRLSCCSWLSDFASSSRASSTGAKSWGKPTFAKTQNDTLKFSSFPVLIKKWS